MTIERSGSATRTPAALPIDSVQVPATPSPSVATTGAAPSPSAPAPLRGPGEAFRHQIHGVFNSVRTLDPSRTDDGIRRTQRQARGELKRLTKQIDSRIDALNREIERNPNALAALGERRALYGLINDYARTAAHLGPYGREVVEGLAEVLWNDAVVLESSPGRFAIWNTKNSNAPALVAQLPSARELDAQSFDVAPIAAPPQIGHAAADRARAADLPQLAHVAGALPNSGVRVGELFDDDRIHFTHAPDPTEMLRRTHATNAERDVGEGAELSVLSYNVALLRYEVFGFWAIKESPMIEERRDDLARAIFSGGDDVILLQEVWRDQDVEYLSAYAARHGYRAFVAPRDHSTDGLVSFVRESIIAEGTDPTHRAKAYESQQAKEYWAAELTTLGFGTGVKRGFHEIGFRHRELGDIKLFNTHVQAFPDAYLARMEQGRELGLAASNVNNADTVVLIGGDLNAGPYYPHDTWTDEKGNTTDGWWKNAVSLPLLQYYAGTSDLVVAGRSAAEADDDVEMANAPEPPGKDPRYPFTASARDNSLYDRQYGRSEYRARLDHLLGEGDGRLKVLSSEMAYTDDVEVAPGKVSELSDHYGVRTRLLIGKRGN